ncbi:MAG: hypothetical protein R3A10_01675 [Caldilineaceae bacterium]
MWHYEYVRWLGEGHGLPEPEDGPRFPAPGRQPAAALLHQRCRTHLVDPHGQRRRHPLHPTAPSARPPP